MNLLGLIFTGGEGPDPQHIMRIMEEAHQATGVKPLIVAADSGLLLAETAGVQIDWLIGDMDSLAETAADKLAAYPPGKIHRYPEDKDYTDTELAFALLQDKGCNNIWIIGGGGGRVDQLFAIRSMFERDCPPERWITAAEDIRCIDAAHVSELSVFHTSPLFPVSVFPLDDGPWEATSSGLTWPLAGLLWNRGFFGISNKAPEGAFTITAKQGRFMVMWPLIPASGCSL